MSEAQRGSFVVALASSPIVVALVIPGLPSLPVEMTLISFAMGNTPVLAFKLATTRDCRARFGVLRSGGSPKLRCAGTKPAFESESERN